MAREEICKTSRGGTLSTGYLLRLAKFAQEKCGDDNTSSSQVQTFSQHKGEEKGRLLGRHSFILLSIGEGE